MAKKDYIHLSILIDRSGSMANIAKDMEGGLKTMLEEQQKLPGSITVSLAKFDDQYELVYDFLPIAACTDLSITPRGGTALYDAAYYLIDGVSKKINSLDIEDRPEKVLFVIITDGQNNMSTSYDAKTIKELISEKKALNEIAKDSATSANPANSNWEFVFLGANFDVEQEAVQGLNVSANSTLNYSTNYIVNTMTSLNNSISRYRSDFSSTSLSFTNEERAMSNPDATPPVSHFDIV